MVAYLSVLQHHLDKLIIVQLPVAILEIKDQTIICDDPLNFYLYEAVRRSF